MREQGKVGRGRREGQEERLQSYCLCHLSLAVFQLVLSIGYYVNYMQIFSCMYLYPSYPDLHS